MEKTIKESVMNYRTLSSAMHDLRKALFDQDWSAIEKPWNQLNSFFNPHGIYVVLGEYNVFGELQRTVELVMTGPNKRLTSIPGPILLAHSVDRIYSLFHNEYIKDRWKGCSNVQHVGITRITSR